MKSARELLNDANIRLTNYREGEHRALCPVCSHLRRKRTDECLAVKVDARGATWKCWNCGWAAGQANGAPCKIEQSPRASNKSNEDWAAQIWSASKPISGTIAEAYLRSRAITCTLPASLRFHPSCPHGKGEKLPAMIALLRDIKTNKPCGIHRTFLKRDGSGKIDGDQAKMMLGRSKGAAVKLSPCDEVTVGLGIAEGAETALSLISTGWKPMWAVGSAGNIEVFPVLAGIECVTIFADHDEPGLKAANACARRWTHAGQEARIFCPRLVGGDWNDVLQVAA